MTVDFWDLGKLLARRWRICLPLLLLTITATALIHTKAKPDYQATAYIQLVSPTPVAVPAGQPTPNQRNPWLYQDLKTIGNAALISVQDTSYLQHLKDAGYTDTFTATMSDTTPLITFQVTAKSAHQATSTANQLITRYNQSLQTLQTTYGVVPVDLITSRRLDNGTNTTISTANAKRALIAVTTAGLLLTIALTIATDTWQRRRKHQHQLA
jgi:capsular polysaccharide biosynthesis protein